MEWRALLARLRSALHPDPDAAAILDVSERLDGGMNRRHFLRAALVGVAVAATVDVEQLLWTPGAKTILLPPPIEIATDVIVNLNSFATADWITRESLRLLEKNLTLGIRFNRQYDITFNEPTRFDLRHR